MASDSISNMVSLVSTELKTKYSLNSDGTNFLTWKKNLDFILHAESIAYVLTDPSEKSDDKSHEKTYEIDDASCRHIILSSIDNDLSIMYQDLPTAKSLMEALTIHFKPTLSRRFALHKQYFDKKMANNCPIGRHIAQMGALAAELEAAGVEVPETTKVMALIASLPESWKEAVLSDGLLREKDLTVTVLNERLRSVADLRGLKKSTPVGVKIAKGFAMFIGAVIFIRVFGRRRR